MSFSEYYVNRRTRKNTFLKQINAIIDWTPIEKEINKVYKKGKSVDGRPSYPGILLFKMQLLQIWYQLSDPGVEDMVNDSLSAMLFCGLDLESEVPDHSTLSRFRSELVEKKAYDRLLRKINKQLKSKGIMIKTGRAKIDASITDSPWSPKGKKQYEIAIDREENERDNDDIEKEKHQQKLIEVEKPGVDAEARWVKKQGQLHYGYKRQIAVDEDGLVEAVHTTPANEHDSNGLIPLLEKTPKQKRKEVLADKGYKVPKNDEYLKNANIKNRIQHKAYRNRSLTYWEKEFNKIISRYRYKVERTFGSMSRWFGAGRARYKGLNKTHGQHVLEAIAYNLKRTPRLALEKCV